MARETENATEIIQNSGNSLLFHEQNLADQRLTFCANVSHFIRKIQGNSGLLLQSLGGLTPAGKRGWIIGGVPDRG